MRLEKFENSKFANHDLAQITGGALSGGGGYGDPTGATIKGTRCITSTSCDEPEDCKDSETDSD